MANFTKEEVKNSKRIFKSATPLTRLVLVYKMD